MKDGGEANGWAKPKLTLGDAVSNAPPTLDTATVYVGGCLIKRELWYRARGTTAARLIRRPILIPTRSRKDFVATNSKVSFFHLFRTHAALWNESLEWRAEQYNFVEQSAFTPSIQAWLLFMRFQAFIQMPLSGVPKSMNSETMSPQLIS